MFLLEWFILVGLVRLGKLLFDKATDRLFSVSVAVFISKVFILRTYQQNWLYLILWLGVLLWAAVLRGENDAI